MKRNIILSVIFVVIIALCALAFDWGRRSEPQTSVPPETDFSMTPESNVSASSTDVHSLISVPSVKDNQTVTSPIQLSGKAVGSWYFEASFPIELVDSNGDVLATTTGQAQGTWATTSFVSFTAQLSYAKATTTRRGLIVLSNDNPSGDQANEKQIFIPVILK